MDFDNIFEGLKENKKSLIVVLILTLLVIIFSVFNLVLKNDGDDINMKGIVNSFASVYYEDYYYPEFKSTYGNDYVQKLKQYEKEGIKLSLREIVNTFSELDSSNFYKEGNYCDFLNTYAVIYPKSPYDISNYEVKVNISCEKEIIAD